MLLIPVLGRQRQEDEEFKATRLYLQKKKIDSFHASFFVLGRLTQEN